MCTQQQLHKITEQIAEAYRREYGPAIVQILLYGSYARGSGDEQSDIDIAGIVRGDRRQLQDKLKVIWNISADIGLENDIVISPVVIPSEEFEKYKSTLPYYRNIWREGIEL